MSNSQPAVACGYGEAQQGISNIQGKYKKLVGWKFLVGYWIFSPPKNLMEPAKSRGPTEF